MKLIVFCVAFLLISAALWLAAVARRKRSVEQEVIVDNNVDSTTFDTPGGAEIASSDD